MTSLFIGVVSHEGSRFAISQGSGGLAHQLAEQFAPLGISTQIQVNTDDLWEETGLGPVTDQMTQMSLTAQLQLERTWARFTKRPMNPRWWVMHSLRWAKRIGQRLKSPGPLMTERLLNIELSHRDLLHAGVTAGCDWILILEDDAATRDVVDCAVGLSSLMRTEGDQPQYVNISQSFTNVELGIEPLLSPLNGHAWEGFVPRTLLSSERPVTNTVCALLYRSTCASRVLATMTALPMEPVVPIDWKLNLALMELFSTGELVPGDCWLVDPAPIVQMSMHTME